MLEASLTSLELSVSLALQDLTVQAVRFKGKMLPANYEQLPCKNRASEGS